MCACLARARPRADAANSDLQARSNMPRLSPPKANRRDKFSTSPAGRRCVAARRSLSTYKRAPPAPPQKKRTDAPNSTTNTAGRLCVSAAPAIPQKFASMPRPSTPPKPSIAPPPPKAHRRAELDHKQAAHRGCNGHQRSQVLVAPHAVQVLAGVPDAVGEGGDVGEEAAGRRGGLGARGGATCDQAPAERGGRVRRSLTEGGVPAGLAGVFPPLDVAVVRGRRQRGDEAGAAATPLLM